jgi:hypothetical protein
MENEFQPPRRIANLIQVGLFLIFAGAGAYFFFLAARDPSGRNFLLFMLIALLAFSPLPLLAYRAYALLNGIYILRRDGLMIRWGLRREDIPLSEIEWIRPATELGFRLPLPWLRWPGAILGSRSSNELGQVEFMAANLRNMLLVATPQKVFAISPAHRSEFMAMYQQINELGSLTPIEAQSIYPQVLIGRVWEDPIARGLVLTSLGIGIILFALVIFSIPSRTTIPWIGPGSTAPAERLLLLPILAALIWFFNFTFGIFLFRRGGDLRIAAYMLWGSALLTGLLLLGGSLLLIF